MISQVYTYVQTHQIVQFKYVQCIVFFFLMEEGRLDCLTHDVGDISETKLSPKPLVG